MLKNNWFVEHAGVRKAEHLKGNVNIHFPNDDGNKHPKYSYCEAP